MAGGSTFTWRHALDLHSTLSPFDSPLPMTHSGFKDNIKPLSWHRRNIAGHLLTIYGLDELPARTQDVTCIWLLHGRGDTQDSMSYVAVALLRAWDEHRRKTRRASRPAIGITLDQRNHGSRMVDNTANVSWKQGNPTHGPDMFNLYAGTAADLSFLLTHLPSYFPFRLAKHVSVGVSLGGHATWQLLVNEPRISAGIVVIGCPDYVRLMTDRAIRSQVPSTQTSDPPGRHFLGSSDFPPSLIAAVEQYDPAGIFLGELDAITGDEHLHVPSETELRRLRPMMEQRLAGKKILCLSGGKDRLVPHEQGKPFIDWLQRAIDPKDGWVSDMGIEMEVVVDKDGRHDFTPELRSVAERWLCDVLDAEDESPGAASRNSRL